MKYQIRQTYIGWAGFHTSLIVKVFRWKWIAILYKYIQYDFLADPVWKGSFDWKIEPCTTDSGT